MYLFELADAIKDLESQATGNVRVALHKPGATDEIKSFWIGASGVLYLSTEEPRIPYRQWLAETFPEQWGFEVRP